MRHTKCRTKASGPHATAVARNQDFITMNTIDMEIKRLKTGLWYVEAPSPNGTIIETFKTYEEAEAFALKQVPYMKFLTQLKNLLK